MHFECRIDEGFALLFSCEDRSLPVAFADGKKNFNPEDYELVTVIMRFACVIENCTEWVIRVSRTTQQVNRHFTDICNRRGQSC
jgi:hypothetical protein